ncbi:MULTISPECIES: transcriptional regulator [Erwinia]|uniref:transcriptional regulator n=1 Tax=Erwinia TaxID=551 RepID=UPI000A994A76|nr:MULTISPECIES: transcriptional regulator [Erwinia]
MGGFLNNKAKLRPVIVAADVRELRIAAGLTQEKAAEQFGFSLRSWQTKEATGADASLLRQTEYEYLLLLAGRHPHYVLKPRN